MLFSVDFEGDGPLISVPALTLRAAVPIARAVPPLIAVVWIVAAYLLSLPGLVTVLAGFALLVAYRAVLYAAERRRVDLTDADGPCARTLAEAAVYIIALGGGRDDAEWLRRHVRAAAKGRCDEAEVAAELAVFRARYLTESGEVAELGTLRGTASWGYVPQTEIAPATVLLFIATAYQLPDTWTKIGLAVALTLTSVLMDMGIGRSLSAERMKAVPQ